MTTAQKIASSIGILSGIGLLSVGAGLLSVNRLQAATPVDSPVVTADVAAETPDDGVMPAGCARMHGAHLEQMAEDLGMSVDELKQEVATGKPFYQIAAEHGKTFDTFKSSRLEDMQARLDDMVKVGYMTQEQADAELQKMENMPMVGMGGHHGFGRGFGMMK